MAGDPKDSQSRFYFTPEQLTISPSRKCGMDADQELQYRQRAANLIQDMGQRLHVSQLCINTAIVYMHRFYAFHSFTHFHRDSIAKAALFLAAKVEEQPRKLEHVIKVAHLCLNLEPPDPSKETYQEQAQDLVFNENVLLQTLGFDVAIDHPHTHVVKTCSLVKASKELAQTSYFMASNSLHLTTMCLQYRPTVVACFCIHLACKWSRWEIPQSTEGKHWFQYVDKSVTLDLLKQLTDEFLHIFDRCPTRLKRLKNLNSSVAAVSSAATADRITDEGALSSSNIHHKSGHHSSSVQHHSSQQKITSSIDHKNSSSQSLPSSSRSSSSSQLLRPPKVDRPTSTVHGYMHPISSSNSGNASNEKALPSQSSVMGHNVRSQSTQGSSLNRETHTQQQYLKQRVPIGHPVLQTPKERQQHINNGSVITSMPSQQIKQKILPATIGVGSQSSDNVMRKSQNFSTKQNAANPPSSSFNQQQANIQHNRMPMQNIKQQVQQSNQPHSTKSTLHQSLPQHQLMTPTFALLDDSILSTESLKVSPTENKSKQASIFSPDWKDTSCTTTMLPQQSNSLSIPTATAQPNRTNISSGNVNHKINTNNANTNTTNQSNNNNNNNNNNNGSNMHKKQPQLQSSLLLDNHAHMDFVKQEKISTEPPQQLLAPVPTKIETKKRQIDDEFARDTKMRRLEARFEGISAPDHLTFDAKQDKHHQQQQQQQLQDVQYCNSIKNSRIDESTEDKIPQTQQVQSLLQTNIDSKKNTLPINGVIETNPAAISNLLKESLFNDNSKSHTILPALESENPMEANISSAHDLADSVVSHHRKSEKKKKKDKHKHKDRNKDRDEKKEKKHKKEKYKNRDRSRERETSNFKPSNMQQQQQQQQFDHQQLKMTISTKVLDTSNTGGIKIKIPKEKLKMTPEDSNISTSTIHHPTSRMKIEPPLKIKIPKNVIQQQPSNNSNNNNK